MQPCDRHMLSVAGPVSLATAASFPTASSTHLVDLLPNTRMSTFPGASLELSAAMVSPPARAMPASPLQPTEAQLWVALPLHPAGVSTSFHLLLLVLNTSTLVWATVLRSSAQPPATRK